MDDDDVDEGWPPSRVPDRDIRVIGAIHGAGHAVSRRLGAETRVHGLDVSETEAEIAGYTSRVERHAAQAVYEACLAIGHRERGVSD